MVEFEIDVRRRAFWLLVACIAAEVGFVALDYHINYAHLSRIGAIRRLFNATREDGLASFFAVTQTFLVSLTAFAVFAVERRRAPGPRSLGWLVIALFFLYMAVDDGAKVHERLGTAFRISQSGAADGLGGAVLSAFPSYAWQVLFLPFFAALGAFTLVFLWVELDSRALRWLVVLAIACFAVAVGLDFVEGLDREHPWNLYRWIAERWAIEPFTRERFGVSAFRALRHFSKSIEESIEMLGNSLLWYVLLRALGERAYEIRIRLWNATSL